jgi:putative membrane protein
MLGWLLRLLVTAFGLWLAERWVPGFVIESPGLLLVGALVLGLVNAFVRPVVVLLTLPFTVLTLGLFLFVVNAAMIGLVAWLVRGISIDGFLPALYGSIVVTLVSALANWWIAPTGRFEVMVVRRDWD